MDNFRRNLLVNKKSGGEFVDLGLPSGLKWAKGNLKKSGRTCVIGEETDYGDFWSWGNVGSSSPGYMPSSGGAMTRDMYKSTLGYNLFYDIPVDATYDTARYHLRAPWRLPSKADFDELIANTDSEWTSINGIKGRKFMKKSDHSVYIFFPASGTCGNSGLSRRGSRGCCWSSTYYSSSGAYHLNVSSSDISAVNDSRYYGRSVRPVQ